MSLVYEPKRRTNDMGLVLDKRKRMLTAVNMVLTVDDTAVHEFCSFCLSHICNAVLTMLLDIVYKHIGGIRPPSTKHTSPQ